MGCCMFGCLTAPIKAVVKLILLFFKMVVWIVMFFLKLVTLPFRLFRRSTKHKPPEDKD